VAALATLGGVIAADGYGGTGPNHVVVSATACAPGWVAPRSGRTVLSVENTSKTTFDVDLVGQDQVSIYGEIELLAPGLWP
jgi:hypothetical protein